MTACGFFRSSWLPTSKTQTKTNPSGLFQTFGASAGSRRGVRAGLMVVTGRGGHGCDRVPIEVAQRPDLIEILEPVLPVRPEVLSSQAQIAML